MNKSRNGGFSAHKTEEAQTFSFPAPATGESETAAKTGGTFTTNTPGGTFANSSDGLFGIGAGAFFGTKKSEESISSSTADKPGEPSSYSPFAVQNTNLDARIPMRIGRGFGTKTFDLVSNQVTVEQERETPEEKFKEDGVSVESGFWYMLAITFSGEEGVIGDMVFLKI